MDAPPAAGLPARFVEHVQSTRLLEPGGAVLVALSGGLDSVVLLHLVRFGVPGLGLDVLAAHFDHAMRPGSAADAQWVAGLCRAWGVPLASGRAEEPLRSEADARRARYRFLHAVAEPGTRVLTAHHADDQAETVLFRAVRGTGVGGLAGIAPRRGRLVRPLLPFFRDDLERYAAASGLRWREDPTNLQPRFSRNRLRAEVLPLLESIVPGAARALARLAVHARADEDAWEWVVEQRLSEAVIGADARGVTLARPLLLRYHPRIRARLLRRVLRRYGSRPDQAGTRAALEFISSGASGRAIGVTGGVRIAREFDTIRIGPTPGAAPSDLPLRIETAEAGSGRAVVGGRELGVRWGPDALEGAEALRRDGLRFPLTLRGWRPGDRIAMGYGTKRLKRLFAEKGVGRADRDRVPILADATGRVVWVAGLARAADSEPVAGEPVLYLALSDDQNR